MGIRSRLPILALSMFMLVSMAIGLWWLDTRDSATMHPEPDTPTPRPVVDDEPIASATRAYLSPTVFPTKSDDASTLRIVEPPRVDTVPWSSLPVARPLAIPGDWISAPHRIDVSTFSSSTVTVAFGPSMSDDGRFVAFTLEMADQGGVTSDQVVIVDRQNGHGRVISTGPNGEVGAAWSEGAVVSADGGTVAFYSWAGNLVTGDTNAVRDVFVHDLKRAVTERVSVSSDGGQANDRSGSSEPGTRPALSADGRFVAFFSVADNLVEGDANAVSDVFVHDRESGATMRVPSIGGAGESNGASAYPSLSANGRYVAFESHATNLLGPEFAQASMPATPQIYLHDRETDELVLLSKSMLRRDGPGYANGPSYAPIVSADGTTVVFLSEATDLVPDDRNGVVDVFVVSVMNGHVERVSVASSGVQANRASTSPALSADGRSIAFVSHATNLVSGDANQEADVFIHDRRTRRTQRLLAGADAAQRRPSISADGTTVIFGSTAGNIVPAKGPGSTDLFVVDVATPPVYTIFGRTLDADGHPIADVQVRAGRQSALSDPSGVYTLTNLLEGTYTLLPQKSGYSFDASRRIVTVAAGKEVPAQDFTGVEDGSPPQPFLDLPLAYDGTAEHFLQILLDVEEGGRINAWFDHAFPNQGKTGAVVLWNGRSYDQALYNGELGCYERRCYDGHGGTDFPYDDHNGPAPNRPGPVSVYPAAPGAVIDVVSGCVPGDERCGGGFGNHVVLNHRNGYFSRYAHLARVETELGDLLTGRSPLGLMGSTGRSSGAHLHLSIHRDDGNGLWDGDKRDLAVDPFGWSGIGPDPWVTEGGGPISHWLWLHRLQRTQSFLGSQGTTLRSGAGDLQVDVPAQAFQGQLQLELEMGDTAEGLDPDLRRAGQAVRIGILEWLDGGDQQRAAVELGGVDNVRLSTPLEITTRLDEAAVRHLDLSRLTLATRSPITEDWTQLHVNYDPETRLADAVSSRLGVFVVAAPLRCPQDFMEPDDHTYLATSLSPGTPITRTFDIEDDQDWFRLEVEAGTTYRWQVQSGGDTESELVLLDVDGVTEQARVAGAVVDMHWTASRTGTVFARAAPTGNAGCDARYELLVEVL